MVIILLLKIRELFWKSNTSDDSLVRHKSNLQINSKNDELNNLARNIELLEFDDITVEDNLSAAEQQRFNHQSR